MNMKLHIRILATLTLAFAMVGLAAGQGNVFLQNTADVSNVAGAGKQASTQFFNQVGSANIALEFKYSGSPATASIPVQGCMRGGTCTTLSTVSTTANQIVFVNSVYDYIQVVPTLTGGTNPFVTVNYSAVSQSAGSSFLLDSSNRIVIAGAGAGAGITQAAPVFVLPNTTVAGTAGPTTQLVIAALTTPTNIKASAGGLYMLSATNTNASVCYIQAFDIVQGSVILGATVPKLVLGLGPTVGATNSVSISPFALYFSSTALSVAATTTPTGATPCAVGVAVSAIAQ